MIRPSPSIFKSLDFSEWRERNALVLTPKFQRRGVWTLPARSHLIDTLMRNMPVPPIYLRETQASDKKRIVREVVDGQQRISAVLDFLDDAYSLSKTLDALYAGKRFSELTDEQQNSIRKFEFMCLMLGDVSDSEILETFARLNTYAVKLNAQELRNGKFFGLFKQSAYALAFEHVEFWRRNGIFSERNIARMLEVELTSELLIVLLDGLQDKKKSIDGFYRTCDARFPERRLIVQQFRTSLEVISEAISSDQLKDSEFWRSPLFYSLFCAIAHRMFGLKGVGHRTPKKRPTRAEMQRLLSAVLTLSEYIVATRETRLSEGIRSVYHGLPASNRQSTAA